MAAIPMEFLLILIAFFAHSNRARETIVSSHRELSEKRDQDIEEHVDSFQIFLFKLAANFNLFSCVPVDGIIVPNVVC